MRSFWKAVAKSWLYGSACPPAAAVVLRRLELEQLENRLVPATITVNTTTDSAVGAAANNTVLSLRQAIQVANDPSLYDTLTAAQQQQISNPNTLGQDDLIVFNIGNGVQVIQPPAVDGALPALSDSSGMLTINGGGNATFPNQVIDIDGSAFIKAGDPNVTGLTINGFDMTIQNLAITDFTGDGIDINNPGSNVVTGCTISGSGLGNQGNGIVINNSLSNTIGAAGAGNDISFNGGVGVLIRNNSYFNQVKSNTISYNTSNGVQISSNSGTNYVGSNAPNGAPGTSANNIIGNKANGVAITGGPNTASNQVNGNYIGLLNDGGSGVDAGNSGDGINISAASTTVSGNVISANQGNGVNIVGGTNTILLGNYIGTAIVDTSIYDSNGARTGNVKSGVSIYSSAITTAKSNEVGQAGQTANVISGNYGDGVTIAGPATNPPDLNKIINNIIGGDVTGKNALTNDGNGVSVTSATLTDVDSNTFFIDNGKQAIISKNSDNSELKGMNTSKTVGLAGPGTLPAVEFVNCTNVTIGGPNPGDGNVFDMGLALVGCSNVTIQGNVLGQNPDGTSAGNPGNGLYIDSTSSNITVGGTASGEGNTIADNGQAGVEVAGTGVSLVGNTIDASNTTSVLVDSGAAVTLAQNTLGSVVVSGGSATFTGTSTASVTVSGGTLNLSSGASFTVSGPWVQQSGSTYLLSGSNLLVTGSLLDQGGQFNLSGAALQVDSGLQISSGAALLGAGTITANVTNAGAIVVGGPNATGSLHIAADSAAGISGNYTQTSSGTLAMEIASASALDQLMIDGLATLNGALDVSLLDGFTPTAGQSFDLITYGSRSGTFANVSLPSYSGGYLVAQYDTPPNNFSLLAN
jgi:hypothetical protein